MREDPSMEVRKMAEQTPDGKNGVTHVMCVYRESGARIE